MQHAAPFSRALAGQHARCDRFGVIASSACAIHCGLGAILVGASSYWSAILGDHRIELAFLVAAVTLAAIAIGAGYRRHRRRAVVAVAVAGATFVAASHAFAPSRAVEAVLSVIGAALLIAAHVRNARLCHEHAHRRLEA